MRKQIRLNAFHMNAPSHTWAGLWAHPNDVSTQHDTPEYWMNLGRTAERGKLDAVFLADVIGVYDVYGGSPATAIRTAAAQADIEASGYNGEKIVIINPTDFLGIAPFGDVTFDLFRKLGLNVEIAETDWGTVQQRRNNRELPSKGGWSVFHTWWTGASTANPAVSAPLRGQGNHGWFGWFRDQKIESLTQQWLQANSDDERLRLANATQQEAQDTVPSIPLGTFYIRSAYRSDLVGLLEGTATYSWNVRRG